MSDAAPGGARDYENPPNVAVVVTPLRSAEKLAAALKLGESQGLALDCLVVDSRSGALAVREVKVAPLAELSLENIDSFDFDSLSMDDLLGTSSVAVPDSPAALLGDSGGAAESFDRTQAPALDPASVEALAQFVSTLLPGYEVLLLNKVASKVTATRWLKGESIGTVPPGLVMSQLDDLTQALVLGTKSIAEIAGVIDPATYTPGQALKGLFNPFKRKPKESDE